MRKDVVYSFSSTIIVEESSLSSPPSPSPLILLSVLCLAVRHFSGWLQRTPGPRPLWPHWVLSGACPSTTPPPVNSSRLQLTHTHMPRTPGSGARREGPKQRVGMLEWYRWGWRWRLEGYSIQLNSLYIIYPHCATDNQQEPTIIG